MESATARGGQTGVADLVGAGYRALLPVHGL